MKAGEIIRTIVLSLFGIGFILFLQPLFYEKRWLGLVINDVKVTQWLENFYMKGAYIVLGVCLVTMIIWYVITSFFASGRAEEFMKWRLIWFLLLLLPIAGIGISLFLNSDPRLGSKEAQISLALFYVFDTLWLYWLTTVTSSPTPVKYVPPGAFPIRKGILRD